MLRSVLLCCLLFALTFLVGCADKSVPLPPPPKAAPNANSPPGQAPPTEDGDSTDNADAGDSEAGDEGTQDGADATDSDADKDADDKSDEGKTDADSADSDEDPKAADGDEDATGDSDAATEDGDADKQDADGEDGDSTDPPQAEVSPLKSERVVLFTSRGPLLVEMQLSIDAKPHDEALGKLVQYVLDEADTDGDGKATWEELTENPKFTYGQLGNAELTSAGMRRSAIELYDVIRNGRVDPSEVPRFLTRNAGGSRSFDFRSANYYRDINRGDSPLFRLLDANEDGRLDYKEAARAGLRMQSRDADADGVLLLDELAAATDDRPGPLTQRRVSASSSSAWLNTKTKWGNVLYAMEEQYMLGGALEKSAFELDPSLFDHLDQDKDGRIEDKEISGLLKATPHIRLEANFGEKGETEALRVTHFAEQLTAINATIDVSENRVTVQLPSDRLLIFLKDEARAVQVEQQARALLAQYDADKNKYIDEDEFPESAPGLMGGLEAYDADGDGKVYEKELADYLANVRVAQRSQIHSRAGDLSDALFDALDENSDGRIDGRETSAIADNLRAMDADADQEIIVDEIPGSMALAVVRGDPQQSDMLFSIPVAQVRPPENAPRWFIRMDRNQDGAIANSEFLGDQSQFDELDVNSDGFVSADEAPAPPEEQAAEKGSKDQSKPVEAEATEEPVEAKGETAEGEAVTEGDKNEADSAQEEPAQEKPAEAKEEGEKAADTAEKTSQ